MYVLWLYLKLISAFKWMQICNIWSQLSYDEEKSNYKFSLGKNTINFDRQKNGDGKYY